MKIYHHDLSEATKGLSVTMYKSQKDFEDYLAHTDAIGVDKTVINDAGQIFGTVIVDALELSDPIAFGLTQGLNAILKIGTAIGGAIKTSRETREHVMAKDNIKPSESLEWNWTEIEDKYHYGRWEFPGNFVVVTKGDKHNFVYSGYINPGGLMGITEQNGKVYGGTDLYFNVDNDNDAYNNNGHYLNTGLSMVGVVGDEGLRRYQVNLGLDPYTDTHPEYKGKSYGFRMYGEVDHKNQERSYASPEDKMNDFKRYVNDCAGRLFDGTKNMKGELLERVDQDTIDKLKDYLDARKDLQGQDLFNQDSYDKICYPIEK
jgi:hypothetical protein